MNQSSWGSSNNGQKIQKEYGCNRTQDKLTLVTIFILPQ